nr:hypothetical protein [Tanacetum cinerariifolium]
MSLYLPLASPFIKDDVPLPPKESIRVGLMTLEPEQSLIPPFREVNVADTGDKSLSRAFVQSVTQLKAPTDLKTKKKKIPPSSKPKSPYMVGIILRKKQVAETQHAEVTKATADTTLSLEASESVEEQVNQPTSIEAEKVLDQKVEETVQESGFVAMKDVTFEKIMDEFYSETRVHCSSIDQDVIDITPKDTEDGDASECLWPKEGTETLHAFVDKLAQSDPLGHLHEELYLLHKKVNQLESSITKHVSDFIQSTVPLIVTNTLKDQLPGLLLNALKYTLPQFIKDSINSYVSESIPDELPQQWEKNNPESPAEEKDAQHPDQTKGKQDSEATTNAIVQGEQPSSHSSYEDTSGKKETDDEPLAKKLKFLIPSASIPSPTPLKSIMPEPLKVTKAIKMTLDQFTKYLSKTTPSIFSPTPPRELTLPKDQTPPRDKSKGKSIATEDPLKEIMPFMEEGGSALKISSLKSFADKFLKKILNPATIRAHAQKMAEHEAKRQKMLDEYNHQISFRADQLPVTKINYVVNSK